MNRAFLLLDSIDAYVVRGEPRAANENGDCQYRTDDGCACAIGRHIPDDDAEALAFKGTAEALAVRFPDVWKRCFGKLHPHDAVKVQRCHDLDRVGTVWRLPRLMGAALSPEMARHEMAIRFKELCRRWHVRFPKEAKPWLSREYAAEQERIAKDGGA